MKFPSEITIVDVAARDGIQSFGSAVDTDTKVVMVNRLTETGLPVVEVTGFAHPRVIPNLADAEDVCERITFKSGVTYRGLVPNVRGAERGIKTKLDELLGWISVSEAYQKKNQNMTLEQGVEEAIKTFQVTDKANKKWVMALGMSMWCAYEGRIPEERVLNILGKFRNAGMRRFYLAGSLGMEDPRQVSELFGRVLDKHSDIEVGFHVHNLAGTGIANVLAALDAGASFIEGAICGIGAALRCQKQSLPSAISPPRTLFICSTKWTLRPALKPPKSLRPPAMWQSSWALNLAATPPTWGRGQM